MAICFRRIFTGLATTLLCYVPSLTAEELAEAREQDSIVLQFADGRVLTFSADELREISYVTRASAQAAQLPVTKKHVLIRLDESIRDTAESEAGDWVTIDQGGIDSPEWQAAIRDAKKHQGGKSCYTLLRVVLEDGAPGDRIQLAGSKLKKLTAKYDGGGGRYRVENSGAFVLIQHLNGSSRKEGRDPLLVGSMDYGQAKLWVEVPEFGTLGVLGDVVVAWPSDEQRGELRIEVLPNDIRKAQRLVIGPIAVGGPYGEAVPVEDGHCSLSDLPAGTYKILLPDFDMRASRWDVKIVPGMTTHLQFEVRSEEQIVKVQESFVPLPDE